MPNLLDNTILIPYYPVLISVHLLPPSPSTPKSYTHHPYINIDSSSECRLSEHHLTTVSQRRKQLQQQQQQQEEAELPPLHPTNNSFIVIDAILEVSETATTVQIRNAYKRFVTLPANSA